MPALAARALGGTMPGFKDIDCQNEMVLDTSGRAVFVSVS